MENVNTSITINDAPPPQKAMDFNWLRQKGIEYLQRFSGNIWTDYNTHDPGITILDQLCYAINDLSFRIEHELPDLMTDETGVTRTGMFTPEEILTSNPVTLLDLRKIVIDVPGVKNAWIEVLQNPDPLIYLDTEDQSLSFTKDKDQKTPLYLKGLYRVWVEKKENESNDIQPEVRARLMSCRNICEDFTQIRVVENQAVSVTGIVEIAGVEDVNEFAARVLIMLSLAISPRLRFYSFAEMLADGKKIDEILDGPRLTHGFLKEEELLRFDRKTELHTSDMIRELMDVVGVRAVPKLLLRTSNISEQWRLKLDPDRTPRLDVVGTIESLQFLNQGLQIQINRQQVIQQYNLFLNTWEESANFTTSNLKGNYRAVSDYYSFQHQFPLNYGISDFGLPESSDVERKAKAKQLKGYLLFYDQLLANYFGQLGQACNLLAVNSSNLQSYFPQSLTNSIPDVDDLLLFDNEHEYQEWLNHNTETHNHRLERKNRLLNHLMARFAENFTDYSLILFDHSNKIKQTSNPLQLAVRDKAAFLSAYPELSTERFKGFDYSTPYPVSGNRSGLERRIAARLGIVLNESMNLSDSDDEEGFFMLEHLLLRPLPEDYQAYLNVLNSSPITEIKDMGNGLVRIYSPSHGLIENESITINGTSVRDEKDVTKETPNYDGVYQAINIYPDAFEIRIAYIPAVSTPEKIAEKRPSWIRTNVDTTYMLLSKSIDKMQASTSFPGQTELTITNHQLEDQEIIEISRAGTYNGTYVAEVINKNMIRINCPFTVLESEARYISAKQKRDPYSLQLTFIFPDWPGRLKVSDLVGENFRAFVERVIREETPAHITVYIRWFTRKEMVDFEPVYAQFLEQLRTR